MVIFYWYHWILEIFIEPDGEEAEDLLFDHANPAGYMGGDTTLPSDEYLPQVCSGQMFFSD